MAAFRTLRKQLDDLGYYQPLVVDAVPLVEALVHDLLATTHNLRLCKEANKLKYPSHAETDKRPSATSTPVTTSGGSVGGSDHRIFSLESRLADLENLNRECNLIINRQQNELNEKSKRILKLELSSGNPRAKIVTHDERPLILNANSKPKIEISSLVSGGSGVGKHRDAQPSKNQEKSDSKASTSELDMLKMYERRNQYLDGELGRLQAELDKARKLLKQAEKQWNWNLTHQTDKASSEQTQDQPDDGEKSSYMIKVSVISVVV